MAFGPRTRWSLPPVFALVASRAVNAERALADLVEISPRIKTALLWEAGGPVLASTGVATARESLLVGAARELVEGASESRRGGGRVTQLHASLGESEVFVVVGGNGGRGIVAVASGRPTPGLVFYDLKGCLAALAGGEQEATEGADDAA